MTSIADSLEALLRAEVASRVEAVKTAADLAIENIRAACGRVVAELEHQAERIASGDRTVPAVPSVTTASPSVTAAAATDARLGGLAAAAPQLPASVEAGRPAAGATGARELANSRFGAPRGGVVQLGSYLPLLEGV